MNSDSGEIPREGPHPGESDLALSAAVLRAAAHSRRISRRWFLRLGIASGLLAADMEATQIIQNQRHRTVVLTADDPDARRRFPGTSWVLFPGYKTSWEQAELIISLLSPTLGERGQLATLGYSNLGLEVDEVMAAVTDYAARDKLTELHFYGHSFGGMLAVECASRFLRSGEPRIGAIVLDSTPSSKYDVKDQAWFDYLVTISKLGFRVPNILRGGYEFGERIVDKHERTWTQVIDQSLAQLTPLAPSTVLIQTESEYIYNWEITRFMGELGHIQMGFIGNPADQTVNYAAAIAGWQSHFPQNLVSSSLQTIGAFPAHASPQWSASAYNKVLSELLPLLLPLPRTVGGAGGGAD